jgi:hypothetical protein
MNYFADLSEQNHVLSEQFQFLSTKGDILGISGSPEAPSRNGNQPHVMLMSLLINKNDSSKWPLLNKERSDCFDFEAASSCLAFSFSSTCLVIFLSAVTVYANHKLSK